MMREPQAHNREFYVGYRQWRSSLRAIVDPLVGQIEQGHGHWEALLQQATPLGGQVPSRWVAWLREAQESYCFWCGHLMTPPALSVEHVLPYSGPYWQSAARMEQLLSLRVSHPACNLAYATWRRHQPRSRLVRMDAELWRGVAHMIRRHPLFQIYRAQQF